MLVDLLENIPLNFENDMFVGIELAKIQFELTSKNVKPLENTEKLDINLKKNEGSSIESNSDSADKDQQIIIKKRIKNSSIKLKTQLKLISSLFTFGLILFAIVSFINSYGTLLQSPASSNLKYARYLKSFHDSISKTLSFGFLNDFNILNFKNSQSSNLKNLSQKDKEVGILFMHQEYINSANEFSTDGQNDIDQENQNLFNEVITKYKWLITNKTYFNLTFSSFNLEAVSMHSDTTETDLMLSESAHLVSENLPNFITIIHKMENVMSDDFSNDFEFISKFRYYSMLIK